MGAECQDAARDGPQRAGEKVENLHKLYPQIARVYSLLYGKRTIPAEVWRFFHDLHLLQSAKTEDDIADVAWALHIFVDAAKKKQSRRSAQVAKMLIKSLPVQQHGEWYMLRVREGDLGLMVGAHPRAPPTSWDHARVAKSAVAIGVALQDFYCRWNGLLSWQHDFLCKELLDGSCGKVFQEAKDIIDVLNPEAFGYKFTVQLIKTGSPPKAVSLFKKIPVANLSQVVRCGTSDEAYSYFELFSQFYSHGGKKEAKEFLLYMVNQQAYSDDALKVFIRNKKLKDVISFVLYFVSCVRNAAQDDASDGATRDFKSLERYWSLSCKMACCPFSCRRGEGDIQLMLLKVSNVPHVILGELLEQLLACDQAGQEHLLHEREFQQAIEAVLLLSESDVIVRVVERLSEAEQNALKHVLREWARLHLLRILEQNRSFYNAKCEEVREVIQKENLWQWKKQEENSRRREFYFQSDIRRSEEIALVLHMFFEICMFLDPTILRRTTMDAQSRSPPLYFLDTFVPEGSELFNSITDEVCRRTKNLVQSEVRALMRLPGFYDPGLQEFFVEGEVDKVRAAFCEDMAFAKLVQVIARLFGFRDGSMDRAALESSLVQMANAVQGSRMCSEMMNEVLGAALDKLDWEFLPDKCSDALNTPSKFTVASLALCARRLRAACDTVKNQAVQLSFGTVLNAFLQTPPRGWVPLFNSCETVLFFLRFMEKEDLGLAYEKFQNENAAIFKDDKRLNSLLKEAKEYYSEPFISIQDDVTDLCNMDIRGKLIKKKRPVNKHRSSNSKRFGDHDWNLVVDIAGCAAESMKEKYNVPMLPHHTQLVTLLMFANQICQGPGKVALPKTILARVGTGEGKSWIIGMLAAFVALKGMTAHVIIDNDTLLERDHATMKALFQKLSLTADKRALDTDTQVVYCSTMDIEFHLLEKMKQGNTDGGFKNCVMIVDEVDSLIVDDHVYNCYVDEDHQGSDICQWWWTQGHQESPSYYDSRKKRLMEQLEAAHRDAGRKQEGKHYVVDDYYGTVWALDERTCHVKRSSWYLWLELIRKGKYPDYQIQCMTRQTVICKKSCFASYSFIFGLTGSLGTEAEQEYTKKHFNASLIMVPPFLDTCRGQSRPKPKCVKTTIERGAEAQLMTTVSIAKEYCAKVPILVVARDPDRVKKLAERLRGAIPTHASSDRLGPAIIELVDNPGKEAEFQQLVESATQPLEVAGPNGKAMRQWRVTITTAIGARGQDYHVSDELVDEKGGFLLILEYVPDSEREWVQFLGRTARHDHPGQYAVILNSEEYRHISALNEGESNTVDTILSFYSKEGEKRLKEIEMDLSKGTLMHKCTGDWYAWSKEHRADGMVWEDKNSDWLDLCETFENKSLDDINSFFSSMSIPPASMTASLGENDKLGTPRAGLAEGAMEAKGSPEGVYKGEKLNHMRHGKGTCEFDDGRVYSGQWMADKMNGDGIMTWTSGQRYEGQYKHGKRSGNGKISWTDGSSYNGQWYKGKQHGHGQYTNENGEIYAGKWTEGKKTT